MIRTLVDNEELKVTFDDTPEVRDAVFEKLLAFYVKYQCFDGECILQSDNPQIYAPITLSGIADKHLKFDVEWK